MKFMYQAAEERAANAQRMAQLLLNPDSAPAGTIIKPACRVDVDLRYHQAVKDHDGNIISTLYGLDAVSPLVEQYILADLPNLINRALVELQVAADKSLMAAREHLEHELNRVKEIEERNNAAK